MQLEEAGECMRWMISTLETMRPDNGFCETDIAVITILSSLGEFFLDAGDRERAKEYLLKAHRLARAYDMTPIEQVVTCRFLRVGWKTASAGLRRRRYRVSQDQTASGHKGGTAGTL